MMEVDHVLELVHRLSERCVYDRTAQLKGLGKVAEAVEKLEWVGEGLDRIEGRSVSYTHLTLPTKRIV